MTEVLERELVVDGLRTVLAEAGPADAEEAVVFVHGNPGSALDWRDLMGRTGEFARSLAMDMPGFGRADKPRDFALPVEGYARFLTKALDGPRRQARPPRAARLRRAVGARLGGAATRMRSPASC